MAETDYSYFIIDTASLPREKKKGEGKRRYVYSNADRQWRTESEIYDERGRLVPMRFDFLDQRGYELICRLYDLGPDEFSIERIRRMNPCELMAAWPHQKRVSLERRPPYVPTFETSDPELLPGY